MLRLLPILEHMGACNRALTWLKTGNYPTFTQAWDACPNPLWLDWVLDSLVYGLEVHESPLAKGVAPDIVALNAKGWEVWDALGVPTNYDYSLHKERMGEWLTKHRDQIEKWLVVYAQVYDCAVECT